MQYSEENPLSENNYIENIKDQWKQLNTDLFNKISS